MEETYNTKAIILDRQPFRESDSKVAVFCFDKGRQELVARGTRKISSKLSGHIEPLTLANIMIVRGKHYNYLGSAINENSFINIKNDLDKLYLAGEAINIFKKLVKENEKDEFLFGLLDNFLKILNNKEFDLKNRELFLSFFIFKLIGELGYSPELFNCVVCKNKITPGKNKLSLSKGGIICAKCKIDDKSILTISDNCIKVLRMAASHKQEKLTKLNLEKKLVHEINNIIRSFYKYNFN